MSYPSYEVLQVSRPAEHVVHVQLNRPDKSNAMNRAFIRCGHGGGGELLTTQ